MARVARLITGCLLVGTRCEQWAGKTIVCVLTVDVYTYVRARGIELRRADGFDDIDNADWWDEARR